MPTVDGKKIYTLALQRKIWNLDKEEKVKVIRYGFPIAPDFGGIAHAYVEQQCLQLCVIYYRGTKNQPWRTCCGRTLLEAE